MSRVAGLLRGDLKNIVRDPMLVMFNNRLVKPIFRHVFVGLRASYRFAKRIGGFRRKLSTRPN